MPIGKILRPVLNEHVTPVSCYWSLALLVREEYELMLVFKVKCCLLFSVSLLSALCGLKGNLFFAELESTSQDVGSNLESVMCIRRLQYSGQFCIASTHMNMLKQVGGWLCAALMIIRTYDFAEDFVD